VVDNESVDDSILEVGAGAGVYSDGSSEIDERGDVRKFLEGQERPVASTSPLAEPARPTWTVRIYEGGNMREEKVEIPEDVLAEPVGKAPAAGGSEKANGSWQGWLEQFLIGV